MKYVFILLSVLVALLVVKQQNGGYVRLATNRGWDSRAQGVIWGDNKCSYKEGIRAHDGQYFRRFKLMKDCAVKCQIHRDCPGRNLFCWRRVGRRGRVTNQGRCVTTREAHLHNLRDRSQSDYALTDYRNRRGCGSRNNRQGRCFCTAANQCIGNSRCQSGLCVLGRQPVTVFS